jgi:3-phosphoshikimate 1-carboxyvinyltransferase
MKIEPATSISGHLGVPGDKSISHRALMLGAVSSGIATVRGFGRSGDTTSTLEAMRRLGARIDEESDDTLTIHGVGLRGLRAPDGPIDCGNAGTLARLLPGLLAFQEGAFTLVGDESLSRRPMQRVAAPLEQMGARITTAQGKLPLEIEGGPIHGIEYTLPVASAQVKSVVLLAGLGALGRTTVIEPTPSRDHTELMLQSAAAKLARRPTSTTVDHIDQIVLPDLEIPGDFSSAAPFIVAAVLLPGSELTIHGVGLNRRRTGLLDALERMGARIGVVARRRAGMEPIGDIEVRSSELTATEVRAAEIPAIIDELPLFALAAACAHGQSSVTGARELRLKESDRVETVVAALRAIGVRAQGQPDGFIVTGVPTRPKGGKIDAAGDHRIAMLGAIAGLVTRDGVQIEGADSVAISFPGFFDLLGQVAQR